MARGHAERPKIRPVSRKRPAQPGRDNVPVHTAHKPNSKAPIRRRVSSSTSTSKPSSALTRGRQPSPEPLLNVLGAPDGDPFETAPLRADRHARELLSLYVGTKLYTTAAVQNSSSGLKFETTLRRKRWYPLAMRSPAGYAGLIAYLETGRANPLRKQTEVYQRQYLGTGLQHLAMTLKDPTKVLDNETCFASLMFLMVALQLNDFAAVQSHVHGLYRLVCHRAKAAGEPPPLVQRRHRPDYQDTGIPDLLRCGHISQRMAEILRHNLILGDYMAAFQQDYIAGFGTGHHIWKSSDFPLPMKPFESACLLCFRIFVQRVATKHRLGVPREVILGGLLRNLDRCDLDDIWNTCPFVLMWMALVAGPAIDEGPNDYFVRLLKEAQTRTFTWSYQAASQVVAQLYFWNPVLNTATEQFWDRIMSTSSMPGSEEDLVETSPLENPPTMQLQVAMRGPRLWADRRRE